MGPGSGRDSAEDVAAGGATPRRLTARCRRASQASRADRSWLVKIKWVCCVFDEAHALKRAGGGRVQRLSRLQCEQRVLLTGTPVQNNLPELFALLTFMLPQIFPPLLAEAMREGSGTGGKPDVNITDAQARRAREAAARLPSGQDGQRPVGDGHRLHQVLLRGGS